MAEDKPIVAPIEARKPKARRNQWLPSTKTPTGARKAAEQSATAMGLVCLSYVVVTVVTYGFNLNWFDASPTQEDLIVNCVVAAIALLLAWRSLINPGPIKAIVILIWVVLEFIAKLESVGQKYPGSFFINVVATIWALNGIRGAFALRKFRKQAAAVAPS